MLCFIGNIIGVYSIDTMLPIYRNKLRLHREFESITNRIIYQKMNYSAREVNSALVMLDATLPTCVLYSLPPCYLIYIKVHLV